MLKTNKLLLLTVDLIFCIDSIYAKQFKLRCINKNNFTFEEKQKLMFLYFLIFNYSKFLTFFIGFLKVTYNLNLNQVFMLLVFFFIEVY